jgi:2-iminobutanoate/2-iminopropanoate deaminase
MKIVATDAAPRAGGHYSQGIVHGGIVYVAGQLPIDPTSSEHRVGTIEEQTERTLRNVQAILQAAGSDLSQVLQWGAVNATYARIMGTHRPARAIVPVGKLHYGYAIEIQAIGAVGDGDD